MTHQIPTLIQHLNEAKKCYIKQLLEQTEILKSAAKAAGISYSTLWRKMKKHGFNHE